MSQVGISLQSRTSFNFTLFRRRLLRRIVFSNIVDDVETIISTTPEYGMPLAELSA